MTKSRNTARPKSLKSLAISAAALSGLLVGSAMAAPFKQEALWQDIGASERIAAAGSTGMLSQRMAASACFLSSGVAPFISRGVLMGSLDETNRILSALRNGNARMKIVGQETDIRVLASLNKVQEKWDPLRDMVNSAYDAGFSGQDLSPVLDWNTGFADLTNLLVSEVAAQYSNPADLLQADALLVDLASRQKMRTQKMLKEACEVWSGRTDAAQLQQSINVFALTMNALRNGEPTVGIVPASDTGIDAALGAMDADWQTIQPVLASVAGGTVPSEDQQIELFMSLNQMLIDSSKVLDMYTKYVKHTY